MDNLIKDPITVEQAKDFTGWSFQTIRRAYTDGTPKGKLDKQLKSGKVYLDKQQVVDVLGMNTQVNHQVNTEDTQYTSDDYSARQSPPTAVVTQDNQVTIHAFDAMAQQLSEKDKQINQLHHLLNQAQKMNDKLSKQVNLVGKQGKQLPAPVVEKKSFLRRMLWR